MRPQGGAGRLGFQYPTHLADLAQLLPSKGTDDHTPVMEKANHAGRFQPHQRLAHGSGTDSESGGQFLHDQSRAGGKLPLEDVNQQSPGDFAAQRPPRDGSDFVQIVCDTHVPIMHRA